jgi:uncharacterized protein (DUF305 family)
MRKANLGLCVAATLALALPVAAQSSMAGMSGKSMGDMKGMGGIGEMMAHHQGAVDMSEIELRMGHDEGAKAIARKTAAENRASIAEIEAWLAKH